MNQSGLPPLTGLIPRVKPGCRNMRRCLVINSAQPFGGTYPPAIKRNKKGNKKGTEALSYYLLPRPASSHLTKPNTITLLNLLTEPVVTDRLAIVRSLTDQADILPVQVRPEEFPVGMATLITA